MAFKWTAAAQYRPADRARVEQLERELLERAEHREFYSEAVADVGQLCKRSAKDATFELARRVKTRAQHLGIDASNGMVELVVRLLHEQLGRPGTFTAIRGDFLDCLRRCNRPAGEGAIDQAADRCRSADTWPGVYDEAETDHLLALCRELATASSTGVFFLSTRDAARICGFDNHVTAGNRLRIIVADHWLDVVETATKVRARRFRLTTSAASRL